MIDNIKISFKQEQDGTQYTLEREGEHTRYEGRLKWLGNQERAFRRIFQLSQEESYTLEMKIVDEAIKWYDSRRNANPPYRK